MSFRDEQWAQARQGQLDCMPWEHSWVAARWEVVMWVRAHLEDLEMTV